MSDKLIYLGIAHATFEYNVHEVVELFDFEYLQCQMKWSAKWLCGEIPAEPLVSGRRIITT